MIAKRVAALSATACLLECNRLVMALLQQLNAHVCAERAVCCAVLAYTVASLSPNMDVANAALPAYVVTLLFFAGFLLRWDDIPNYWIWCVWMRSVA